MVSQRPHQQTNAFRWPIHVPRYLIEDALRYENFEHYQSRTFGRYRQGEDKISTLNPNQTCMPAMLFRRESVHKR
jgi:hypothetical protein